MAMVVVDVRFNIALYTVDNMIAVGCLLATSVGDCEITSEHQRKQSTKFKWSSLEVTFCISEVSNDEPSRNV